VRCFYYQKEGHVKNDCLVWKKVIEEEEKNSKPKVGVNVAMVDWGQLVVNVCVTTKGQKMRMLEELNLLIRKSELMGVGGKLIASEEDGWV
jgi:hypothetical protein